MASGTVTVLPCMSDSEIMTIPVLFPHSPLPRPQVLLLRIYSAYAWRLPTRFPTTALSSVSTGRTAPAVSPDMHSQVQWHPSLIPLPLASATSSVSGSTGPRRGWPQSGANDGLVLTACYTLSSMTKERYPVESRQAT